MNQGFNERRYHLIILNEDLDNMWSDFLRSREVSVLENTYSISFSNALFEKRVRRWIDSTAKHFCPPDGELEKVKEVLIKRYLLC